ncbi:LamG-like jellyroll fold domain-containing protein [Alcaligenes sp. Lyrl_28]|uniref:LamG-like jellyroll fold domain-containing protein n=1 Tax=Alcaligenes sp. Lyrl_28 TaxID=3110924 RepID=UPI003F7C861B
MTFTSRPQKSPTVQRLQQAGLSLSLALLLTACGSGSGTNDGAANPDVNPESPTVEPGDKPQALGGKKALIVTIDGLSYDALQQARQAGQHPALKNLTIAPAQTGGYTGTPSEQRTLPLPGWASLITGVWADQHGLRGVGQEPVQLKSPTLVALASEPTPAALAVSTADYRTLWAPDLQEGRIIEAANCTDSDSCVSEQTQKYLQEGKSLILAQIQAPARAASQTGLGSPQYQEAVQESLASLDKLLALIEKRKQADASEDWLLILTSSYGMDEFGSATGSQFNRNKTSFIATNKTLASLPAIDGQVTSSTDMNTLAAVIDIAPTVLSHLGVQGEQYAFRGSPLQAQTRIRNLSFNKPADKNMVDLNWVLDGDASQEIQIMRDGKLIATLPAGSTQYSDPLPVSENAQVYSLSYSVKTGQAASTLQAEAGYQPPPKLADTLRDGLRSYYTFSAQPFTDSKGGSSLQPASPGVPAGELLAADFLDPTQPQGGLRLLGSKADANGNRGYRLALSRELLGTGGAQKLTIGFWFRTPDNCHGYGASIMANKNYDSGNNPGFALGLFNANGCDIRFNTGYGGGRNESQGYNITPDQWAYVAVVIDKSKGIMRGHVFDTKKGAQFGSVALEARTIAALGGTGTSELGLNEDVTGQYYKRWGRSDINMDFGELAIWDRDLSTDELTSIYESRKPLSSLQP